MQLRRIIKRSFEDGIGYVWTVLLSILVTMTVLDFVVNHDLMQYGLVYSLEWFFVYGIVMILIHNLIAVLADVVYWFSTPKGQRRKLVVVTIFVTLIGLWGGGFLDFLWFLFEFLADGKLLSLTQVWWWMPMYWLLGIEWTTLHHIGYTVVWSIVIGYLWWRVKHDKC